MRQDVGESVNVQDLRPGDRVRAWRGTWLVLDPPTRGRHPKMYLRVTDYWNPGNDVIEFKVNPNVEFYTMRATSE